MKSNLDEQQVEVNPKQGRLNSMLEKGKRKEKQDMEKQDMDKQEMDKQEKTARKKWKRMEKERKWMERQAIEKAKKEERIAKSQKIDEITSFYAAAHFWEIYEPRRGWVSGEPDADSSTTITGSLLDLVARFFARAMKLENDSVRNRCPATASDNVTATAMGKGGKKDRLVIYIAKNGGPQDFDGKSDEAMADELESWYNGLDPKALPDDPEDPIWSAMQTFWYHRLFCYAAKLTALREDYSLNRAEDQALIDAFGISKADLETDRIT